MESKSTPVQHRVQQLSVDCGCLSLGCHKGETPRAWVGQQELYKQC